MNNNTMHLKKTKLLIAILLIIRSLGYRLYPIHYASYNGARYYLNAKSHALLKSSKQNDKVEVLMT